MDTRKAALQASLMLLSHVSAISRSLLRGAKPFSPPVHEILCPRRSREKTLGAKHLEAGAQADGIEDLGTHITRLRICHGHGVEDRVWELRGLGEAKYGRGNQKRVVSSLSLISEYVWS